MEKRDQLIGELQGERDYGVLLVAQMGGVPNEIQLIIETARYDEAAQGLRPQHDYILRALGVREHRINLGVFGRVSFSDDHPLLYHYNTPRVAVHFDGKAKNINELVLDISQAYVSTFGQWRHLVDMADDINRSVPMVDLLNTGYGLLGTMPRPLAERMARVLAHHEVKANLIEETGFETEDEHGRSKLARLLLLDHSFVIALDFSVEQMGKR
ncbi:MAG TPA: hypothetical protein VHD90_02620 [Phototrophicaceae bacterium]|nr:hypothetical protein [Phototrophicaceae bacterium]